MSKLDPTRMARDMTASIGREVVLARTNLGLSTRAAARIAGVSATTHRKIELGDPGVHLGSVCAVASAMGLKVWARAFPASAPSLRDTGQLWIANSLRRTAHSSYSVATELGLGNLRSADQVLFGPIEIIHIEIERMLADLQQQYRNAAEKRDVLAAAHHRPVRLVLVVEDTRRNREVVRPHADLIGAMLPAGSREVLKAIRSGEPLGRDGILWIRRRTDR
jgi:transcriptional regulator with XRE-family HTH domain